jgi:ubiquitin carboxyl-terminal hydrolase 14
MKEIGLDEDLMNDEGACVHGQYELVAVLTHLGRTAEGGHYIAWVKKGGDEWREFKAVVFARWSGSPDIVFCFRQI